MEKRAFILKRVSTDGQDPDGQESECRAYAARAGMAVHLVFDEVWSGAAALDERPVLAEIRARIRAGEADALIVYSLSRLTRAGGIDTLVLVQELAEHGCELHCAAGDPHGLVSIGDLGAQIMTLIAGDRQDKERRQLLLQMQRGIQDRARAGRALAGGERCRYGYAWVEDDGTVNPRTGKTVPKPRAVIVPEEAAVVRRIFAEALAGSPTRAIARGLMADGVPSSAGGPFWTHTFIAGILGDPRYKGQASAFTEPYTRRLAKGGNGNGGTRRVRVLRTADDPAMVPLRDGVYPAIMDAATWDAVQARLAYNKQAATRNARHPEDAVLHAGHALCAVCGDVMAVTHSPPYRPGGSTRPRYRCTPSGRNRQRHAAAALALDGDAAYANHPGIPTRELDAAAWEAVKRICTDPAVVERELTRLRAGDGAALAEELHAKQQILDQFIARERSYISMGALAADATQRQEIQAQLQLLAAHRTEAQKAVDQAQARLADARLGSTRLEGSMAVLRRLGPHLDTASYAERRELLFALNVRAYVWPKGSPRRFKIEADIPDTGDTGETTGAPDGDCVLDRQPILATHSM